MSRSILDLAWNLLNPAVSLPLLLLFGIVLLWTRWRRAGRSIATWSVAILLAFNAVQLDSQLAATLENQFPMPALPAQVDGIIVLGGSVQSALMRQRNQVLLNHNADRLVQFAALSRRYPAARLVFTGGGSALGGMDEAALSERALRDLGVDVGRVVFETRSTSTYENAVFSRDLVRAPDETWILVTSAWHMPRAVGSFRQAGWSVIPFPVGYTTGPTARWALTLPTDPLGTAVALVAVLREWISLAVYRARGWTDAWLPAPQ